MTKSTKRLIQEKKGKFKPLVYICSPYRGDIESNVLNAIRYAEYAFKQGAIPVTPHMMFPFLDEQTHREEALFMDLILLGKCQEVWVFGDVITEGMAKEIAVAKKRKQTIREIKHEDCVWE